MRKIYQHFIWLLFGILLSMLTTPVLAMNANSRNGREQAFVERLAQNAAIANQRILHKRQLLLRYLHVHQDGKPLTHYAIDWLKQLAQQYKVASFNLNKPRSWQLLKRRVDIVPISLVIAQAANESAWGTSRFAKLGHAYFGQACYVPGCGIVPKSRPAGRTFEVQSFPSMLAAVESYMHNLNSNPSYKQLRLIRQELRQAQEPISGSALATGLKNYAAIGERYVIAIQSLINRKQLTQYD